VTAPGPGAARARKVRAGGVPFFGRWLRRSLGRNLVAGAVATASLALSSALVFCLVAVSAGVEGQLGKELAAYGANLLVLPQSAPLRFGLGALELGPVEEERHLREADALRLPAAGVGVEAVAPALLARVSVAGTAAGAVGYPLDALRRMNPLWRVSPRWPEGSEAMLGASLAARLSLAPGAEVDVALGGRSARVRVAALVETGGPEDDDLVLPLALLQGLAGRPGEISLALVRADLGARPPEDAARAVAAAVPGAEARTLAQVASAESALLAKVRRLLLLVTLALGAATAFTVSGTLGVLLLSRRQEIGLCLALGAAAGTVRRLLLAEAAASGLAGGVAGCLLGALAAEVVAASVFGALVPLGWAAAPLALGTALALALGAALWPVDRALRVSPCDTLRAP
jgi:putative ABC transport system permease protein